MLQYGSHIYLIIKAIHIIFMVSYFAGIFYLIRLFVYYKEAEEKEEIVKKILQNQYLIMIKKLWNIIIIPAGSIMLITGILMLLASNNWLITQPWIHIKLTFLLGLFAYHSYAWRKIYDIKKGKKLSSSIQLRMLNEVATVLLFLIVFTVILKAEIFSIWKEVLLGLLLLFVFIFGIVKLLNKKK